MQTTYREIATFVNTAQIWLQNHPAQSKFRYALTKMVAQGKKRWEEFTDQGENIDIEFASEDDKKNIIFEQTVPGVPQIPKYTKENALKRKAARKKLFEAVAVEIAPYLSPVVPDDLTDAEREAFAGFVLPIVDEAEPQSDLMEAKPEPAKAQRIRRA